MPRLLSKGIFSHDLDTGSSTVSPPPLKSTRSFLNFIGHNKSNDSLRSDDSHALELSPKPSHSMLELKRFFRPPVHKKPQSIHPHQPIVHRDGHQKPTSILASNGVPTMPSNNHGGSGAVAPGAPSSSVNLNQLLDPQHSQHTQSAIPPSTDSVLSLSNNINIYHDDAILAQKYGKLGKTLGTGAGGSVKILIRPSDHAIFAVKEFRPRKSSESIRDYSKKCTAEFLIGSSLHHPNVVQTMDVFSDSKQNKYFEVMEYLPVDFFAVVMTGKMSRGEINCCFKQICEGVRYLHSMGLAHRDLKLDNCCMNESGILKLIDFGSAVIFRYPFEQKIIKSHGIVGSDPYLAPEVLIQRVKYDPQAVDIWSIGIIFCCMMLKRFPWKVPRDVDDNYKLFSMKDNIDHDYEESAKHHEQLIKERRERRNTDHFKDLSIEDKTPRNNEQETKTEHDKENTHVAASETPDDVMSIASKKEEPTTTKHCHHHHNKKMVNGPYRLLRLLPHASRPLVSKILQLKPEDRATFKEVFDDEWFQSIPSCTMDIDKKTIQRATGHHHTIVKEENSKTHTYKV